MSLATALAVILTVAACSKSPPANVRFMFEVETKLMGDIEVAIGGKPLTLEGAKPNVTTTHSYVDFPVAEIGLDAKPTIKLRSACGERVLAETEYERRPPNESNVVVFRIVDRLFPKQSFVAAVDPAATDVKLGSYSVPASHPDAIKLWGACSFKVSVGSEILEVPAPENGQVALLVASSASACLQVGVVVYAVPGASCDQEWSAHRRGQLAYWSDVYPTILFQRAVAADETVRGGAKCVKRGFVNRC